MAWYNAILSAIPGGSLVNGLISLGQTFMGNRRRENRLDAELQSRKVANRARRRRALIKASPWPIRLFSFANALAPFYAPLIPGVSIEDTVRYVNEVVNGMPDWYVNVLLLMYGFLWGGSEWKALVAQRDEERLTEKEVERDKEHERAKQQSGGELQGWEYD